MDNPLSGLIDKASESLLQMKISSSLPELPDSEEEGEKLKEELDWDNLSEEEKKEKEKLVNNLKDSISDAANKQVDAIKNAAANNINALNEIKADLKDLGISAGLLTVGTLDFAARIALVPMAIISTTPMGPGVSTNLISPLLKSLKGEGDNLSKVYDECSNKMTKLGLDNLSSVKVRSIFPIDLGPLTSVVGIVTAAQSTAKPLILMVGSSVAGETGSLPDVKPPIEVELSAKDCLSFSYIDETDPENIDATNCSNFLSMSGNPDEEKKCTNCKNYKKK